MTKDMLSAGGLDGDDVHDEADDGARMTMKDMMQMIMVLSTSYVRTKNR
jgi:hypothetical protein